MDAFIPDTSTRVHLNTQTHLKLEGQLRGLVVPIKQALRALEVGLRVRSFTEKNTGCVILTVMHTTRTDQTTLPEKILDTFKEKGVTNVVVMSSTLLTAR